MTDTDKRRTRGKPWPECLTDRQLMALLRRRMPERYGWIQDEITEPLDDAEAAAGTHAADAPDK